jgi:hypothetical protein
MKTCPLCGAEYEPAAPGDVRPDADSQPLPRAKQRGGGKAVPCAKHPPRVVHLGGSAGGSGGAK